MCGILFSTAGTHSKEAFSLALSQFSYRGPDNASILKMGDAFLGHHRLSILDLQDGANQPFDSLSGQHVIIFNGEIYNYRELIKKHNIPMRTHCDTELLIELYERMGKKCLDELNGDFAFVIMNTQTHRVFAARDRLGVKPLYLYRQGNQLAFSSEINALVHLFNCSAIDPIGLRQYKKLRTFFNGHTYYRDIQMFPAGSYYEDGKINTYWSLPYDPEKRAPDDEELKALVESAVHDRCIADVPVGSYLSGGLDSTIIAGLAHQPHTWTVGFESFNEFKWSNMAAKQFGTQHTCVKVKEEDFLPTAAWMIKQRKEPLSVPNEVLLYLMTKKVKEKNTVVLSGEGADELFFGYDRIFRWAHSTQDFSIKAFDQHYAYSEHEDDEILESILAPFMQPGYRPIDIIGHFFQVAHLHGLLRRLDNSTMLCSVEARVPFVDHRLVERMAGVSYDDKMRHHIVKAPLKRVFAHLVPRDIIEREKVGFPVPLAKIFNCDASSKILFDRWLQFNLDVLGENT